MMAVLITAELATLAGARGQGCWSGAEAQQLHPPITGQVFPAKNTSLPAATHTPTPLHPGKGTAGLVLAYHPPWWRIDIYQIYAATQAGGSETLPASCRPVLCLVAQSYLTLCGPMDSNPPGSSAHGDSPGKNTGVGCHFLFQGIFSTQGSNPGLLYCRKILYHLSHQESPY